LRRGAGDQLAVGAAEIGLDVDHALDLGRHAAFQGQDFGSVAQVKRPPPP
jgi:hypothetical protein